MTKSEKCQLLVFNELIEKLEPCTTKKVTPPRKPVKVQGKIAVTLRHFATGETT